MTYRAFFAWTYGLNLLFCLNHRNSTTMMGASMWLERMNLQTKSLAFCTVESPKTVTSSSSSKGRQRSDFCWIRSPNRFGNTLHILPCVHASIFTETDSRTLEVLCSPWVPLWARRTPSSGTGSHPRLLYHDGSWCSRAPGTWSIHAAVSLLLPSGALKSGSSIEKRMQWGTME